MNIFKSIGNAISGFFGSLFGVKNKSIILSDILTVYFIKNPGSRLKMADRMADLKSFAFALDMVTKNALARRIRAELNPMGLASLDLAIDNFVNELTKDYPEHISGKAIKEVITKLEEMI